MCFIAVNIDSHDFETKTFNLATIIFCFDMKTDDDGTKELGNEHIKRFIGIDFFLKFSDDLVVVINQLPPTEVSGLFLSSVVERLKADSLPKDSVL